MKQLIVSQHDVDQTTVDGLRALERRRSVEIGLLHGLNVC